MVSRAVKRVLGANALAWCAAAMLAAGGGVLATSQVARFAGWTHAVWMRLEFAYPQESRGSAHLELHQDGEPLPYFWEDEGEWVFLGIAPQIEGNTVTLSSIATDEGPIPLEEMRLPSFWAAREKPFAVEIASAGRVGLPNTFEQMTLTFESSPSGGGVVVTGLGQVHRIDLSAGDEGAVTVRLERPGVRRAWALLPPETTREITLSFSGANLEGVEIFDTPIQLWQGVDLSQVAGETNCLLAGEGETASLRASSTARCTFSLPGLAPLNRIPPMKGLSLWLSTSLCILIVLVLIKRLSRTFRVWDRDRQPVETGVGRWLRRATVSWTPGRVAIAAWVVALVLHLAVALSLPARITPDSVGYYTMGNAILKQRSLNGVDTYRTPGYPLYIASTIWLFGHQTEAIILFQQLGLSLLAPAMAWYLHSRTQPVFALMGGILGGICPLLSLMGNHVWSEPLFAVTSCLGLVVFAMKGEVFWGALLAGVLSGAATMIRPNGSLLLILMLGWIVLRLWLSVSQAESRRRLLGSAALAILGYSIVTLPWYVSFHSRTGRWGLARSSDFTLWNNAFIQGVVSDTTSIYRPYDLFLRNPATTDWSSRDPYMLVDDLTLSGMGIPEESVFYQEAIREGIRSKPARYLTLVAESMKFNILGMPLPDPSPFTSYPEVFTYLYVNAREEFPAKDPGPATLQDGKLYLRKLSYRWFPPVSRLRDMFLHGGGAFLNLWGPVNVLALISAALCLLVPALRHCVMLWAYAAIGMIVPSIVGMPIDRYVMVVEPILYLCVALGAYALVGCRLWPKRGVQP